jgi:site-specific recombinase XerD
VSAAPDRDHLTEVAEGVLIRPMLIIDDAIDLYLGDLARRGYSERTRDTYSRTLDKFADTLPRRWDVAKVGPGEVRRFLDNYNRRAPATRAQQWSILHKFFDWLYKDEQIKRNPMERMERPKRLPADAVDVVTVSTADVRKLLTAAKAGDWTERLAVEIAVYLGPRRHAISELRVKDYRRSAEGGEMRFREKGGKTIWKPMPTELTATIEASLLVERSLGWELRSGKWHHKGSRPVEIDDYLVPSRAEKRRDGSRDDRIIWDAVKAVAKRAGVKTHVHALRAAFAVFYLERNPGELAGLQALMGHRRIDTTQVYLRRLNQEQAMEPVRSLSWAETTDGEAA